MWEKEKMLVTSIFSFSHSVFNFFFWSRSLKLRIVWYRVKRENAGTLIQQCLRNPFLSELLKFSRKDLTGFTNKLKVPKLWFRTSSHLFSNPVCYKLYTAGLIIVIIQHFTSSNHSEEDSCSYSSEFPKFKHFL